MCIRSLALSQSSLSQTGLLGLYTGMCVRWWCVWEPGSSFRPACASCMPWHAKPDRCRWKAAACLRVPRLAHARTYVSRHVTPGMGRDVPRLPCGVCRGIRKPALPYPGRQGDLPSGGSCMLWHARRGALEPPARLAPQQVRADSGHVFRPGSKVAAWGSGAATRPAGHPPHTRFRTHVFANNPRKRCHEALSSGLPVVFRRHESGVFFLPVCANPV